MRFKNIIMWGLLGTVLAGLIIVGSKKSGMLQSVADDETINLSNLEESYEITDGGTYTFSGQLKAGQIFVDAEDEDVEIVLDGVSICNEGSACIYVKKADNVSIVLADGSQNVLDTSGTFESDGDINVDDTIFAKADLIISGNGTLSVSSEEGNGIVSKDELVINSGKIEILKCNEGLEAETIIINDGEIDICAEDDGINAAGGDSNSLLINGGTINIDASGDGLDSNGTIEIAGGYTVIEGPVDNGNSAIDFEQSCSITGGVLIATGSSGMVERISASSTQASITISLSEYTNEAFSVTDSSGNEILKAAQEKKYNCITISSPELKVGETYTVTAGQETKEIELTETVYSDVAGRGGFGAMGGPGEMNSSEAPANDGTVPPANDYMEAPANEGMEAPMLDTGERLAFQKQEEFNKNVRMPE